jgi:tRNA threonylcarbamoyl adenosine modification protein YeaZ
MTILSFYIQHNVCFAALSSQGKITEKCFTLGATETQAMVLIPFIQEILNEAGNPEISCLMTPRGPGSFTSLRVGLAAAQGLELAFPNAQIFSPTHFDVLAYVADLKGSKSFIVLIDSKKGDFYGQCFYQGSLQEPKVYTNEMLKELLENNLEIQVITDLEASGDEFFQDRVIMNDKNLATCQISLYEKEMKLRENPEYQKFQPIYLYLPEYVKRKPI